MPASSAGGARVPRAGLLAGGWGLAGRALAPLAPLHLARRAARGKEDPDRLKEKQGRASLPRPAGELVWVHAASVGETTAVLALAARLAGAGPAVLLTSGTVTAARLLAGRTPAGVVHQYAPLDAPPFAARFLDHWRPAVAIFAESEIWPTLIAAARRRGIPVVVVNGRMSERSFRAWRRLGLLAQPVFAGLSAVAAQSAADASRFGLLGVPLVTRTGNLKGDAPPLPMDETAFGALRAAAGGRPVFVAASTHPGEERPVVAAHRALAARLPGLLTILVPRHPERGEEVAALAAGEGLVAARRAAGELPAPRTAVYVADTLGELGLFYRLAPVAVLGGSFVPVGGHNPFEPARLDCAILTGPHVASFADVYAALAAAGGVEVLAGADALAPAAIRLLENPEAAAAMAASAARVARDSAGALGRTLAAIAPFLPLAARGALEG